jgi:hypothetical protein
MIKAMGVAALLLAGCSGPALAQGLTAENLLVGLPEGFVSGYDGAQDGQELHEFVPQGESVDDWSRMVTIEIFHDAHNIDLVAFAQDIARSWQDACPGSSVGGLGQGGINGYPFVVWRYLCPDNPATDKPEIMWMKAISGADAAYVVQYAYRAELTDDREQAALDYLKAVSACDTRVKAYACPSGM